MTQLERLIHGSLMDQVDEDKGNDLPGGGPDETGGEEDKEVKAEVVVEEEVEGEEKPEGDEPRIPKARFDQAVGKARAAEKAATERADKLEAELKAKGGVANLDKLETDIDKLEDQLEDAVKDGNVELKNRLRREIRAKTGQIAESKAAAYSQYATAVAVEQIRYDAYVERMETEHPELNPEGENFDEDMIDELMDYKTAFEAKGLSSSESLKKAIKAVYGTGAKPEVKAEPADKKEEAESKAEERKEAAVKKGLETKKAQPADTRKAGLDSDKGGKGKVVDASTLSDKDFDNLDEKEKARLRGDSL